MHIHVYICIVKNNIYTNKLFKIYICFVLILNNLKLIQDMSFLLMLLLLMYWLVGIANCWDFEKSLQYYSHIASNITKSVLAIIGFNKGVLQYWFTIYERLIIFKNIKWS